MSKNRTVTKRVSNKKTKKVVPVNYLTSVEMKNLTSDLIQDVSYSNGDLFVTMRNGAKYLYPDVDGETVQEFLTADSFGRFFNEHIRYRNYERLDG